MKTIEDIKKDYLENVIYKIQAIKEVRTINGMSLKEGKEYVESWKPNNEFYERQTIIMDTLKSSRTVLYNVIYSSQVEEITKDIARGQISKIENILTGRYY